MGGLGILSKSSLFESLKLIAAVSTKSSGLTENEPRG